MSEEARERYRPTRAAATVTLDALENQKWVGRLIENYQAKSKDGKREQWFQAIQQLDAVWADGNAVEQLNMSTIVFQGGVTAGKGSEPHRLAKAYEAACGCDMLPGNPLSADMIGSVFEFTNEPTNKPEPGQRQYYSKVPVKYLGDKTFQYTGTVRTITPRGDSDDSPVQVEENLADAAVVAEILGGWEEANVREGKAFAAVVNDPRLAHTTSVLGVSLRGGLLGVGGAPLLNKLMERGMVKVEGGIISTNGANNE